MQRLKAKARNRGLLISHPVHLEYRFWRHFIARRTFTRVTRDSFFFAPSVSSSSAVKSRSFAQMLQEMEENHDG
jgi:hypothetical protein